MGCVKKHNPFFILRLFFFILGENNGILRKGQMKMCKHPNIMLA